MNKNLFLCFATLIFLFIITSCAQGSPEIQSISTQLVKVQQEDLSFSEQLSVFVFFKDTDGDQDFSSITLTHNDTGLMWNIHKDAAVVRLRGNDRWTGSSSLAGPGGGEIPSGAYTIVVSDLAENEAVSLINVLRPVFPEQSPLNFYIQNGQWIIEKNPEVTDFSRYFLLLLDDTNTLLHSWAVPYSSRNIIEGQIKKLRSLAPKATLVQCFVENRSGTAGVLLTPKLLR